MYSDKRVRFTVIEIRNLLIKIIGFSSIKNYFDVRRHVALQMRRPKGKAVSSSSSSSSSSAAPAAEAVESQSEVIARLRKSADALVVATNVVQTAKFNKETGRSRWHGKDQATAKWRKEVLQYQLEQGITGDFMIPEMLCSFTVDVVAKRDKRGKKNVGHKLKPNCVITYYNR